MKRPVFLCTLLCLLLICSGCSKEASAPEVTPAPPEQSEPAPVPEIIVEPEPEPAPPMQQDPVYVEPEYEPGCAITVDGTPMEQTFLIEGTVCADLKEITDALQIPLTLDVSGQARFVWRGKDAALQLGEATLQWGDAALPLPCAPVIHQGRYQVPAAALCELLEMSVYDDAENDHIYCTPAAAKLEIPEGYKVPTLMYHAVSDNMWGIQELFVSPASLEEQLKYLQDNGYTTLWFEDLANIEQYEKPVILTFDDGYMDNYLEAWPLLEKYNAKATFFVITGSLEVNAKSMTYEQVRELSQSGLISIQSHTVNHPYLSDLTREEQEKQLVQSKLDILRITGKEPYVLCYPSGKYNRDTLELVEEHYLAGVKMNGNDYYTGGHPGEINRWYVSRYTTLSQFASMID